LELVINVTVSLGLERGIISGFGGSWLAVVVAFAIILCSDKINLKRLIRRIALGFNVAIFIVCAILGGITPVGTAKIAVGAYYDGGMVAITTSQGSSLIVTDELNTNRVDNFLSRNGISKLTALFIIGGDECLVQYYQCGLSVQDVYLSQSLINTQPSVQSNFHYCTSLSLYGVDYKFVDSYTLSASYNGVSWGICAGQYINLGSCKLVISLQNASSCKAERVVYFGQVEGIYNQLNIYDCGDLHFTINNGKIKMNSIVPQGFK
jgi:hypothetical protein